MSYDLTAKDIGLDFTPQLHNSSIHLIKSMDLSHVACSLEATYEMPCPKDLCYAKKKMM